MESDVQCPCRVAEWSGGASVASACIQEAGEHHRIEGPLTPTVHPEHKQEKDATDVSHWDFKDWLFLRHN